MSIFKRTPVIFGLAFICCLLWGSAFPCIKIGYRLFAIASDDVGSQLLFAGYRFTLAGVLTVLLGSFLRRQLLIPRRTDWGTIFKLSLVQTVLQYVFFYMGLANTTGVKSSIIEASNVFIAILVSSLIFRLERLGVRKIIGCILGFSGVVLINLNGTGLDASMSIQGEGMIFISACAYAFSTNLISRYSQKIDPVLLSGYQFCCGGIVMVILGFAMGGHISGFTPASAVLLIYMALISAVAYTLWGILLKYNPVGRIAVFGFLNPMIGVILSALLLHESNQAFSLRGLISLALVCLGIFIVNRIPETP